MSTDEAELLFKWDQQHSSEDSTDQERQAWFSEAAAYLQANDHWWCQHEKLLNRFAEIFVYHRQPVVQRLWSCLSEQLSTCAVCVIHYHAAQVCVSVQICAKVFVVVLHVQWSHDAAFVAQNAYVQILCAANFIAQTASHI